MFTCLKGNNTDDRITKMKPSKYVYNVHINRILSSSYFVIKVKRCVWALYCNKLKSMNRLKIPKAQGNRKDRQHNGQKKKNNKTYNTMVKRKRTKKTNNNLQKPKIEQ